VQQPAAVAKPTRDEQVAEVVRWASERGLVVAAQASGHGAGAPIGSDTVLVDTSGLDTVAIDADARTGHAGAGTTWTAVNSRAQRHGLLGLAGSSPTVAVAGYTFFDLLRRCRVVDPPARDGQLGAAGRRLCRRRGSDPASLTGRDGGG
jgi:FAD/FMN-containing dehydrogenase